MQNIYGKEIVLFDVNFRFEAVQLQKKLLDVKTMRHDSWAAFESICIKWKRRKKLKEEKRKKKERKDEKKRGKKKEREKKKENGPEKKLKERIEIKLCI